MNSIEQRLTSMEVAEQVGKDHSKLLKDIRRYSEQLAEAKIGLGNFFTESNYKDANNQSRPCYLVTKKGCEFIAHKLTGTKGAEFTAYYIEKFHDMEKSLNPYIGISQELAAAIAVDKRVTEVANRVDKIENDMPLFGVESDEISRHVRRIGVVVLGGKNSEAYKTSSIRKAVYEDIYGQVKREFGLYDEEGHKRSYKALKRKDIDSAHYLIENYKPSTYLKELVLNANAQIRMENI